MESCLLRETSLPQPSTGYDGLAWPWSACLSTVVYAYPPSLSTFRTRYTTEHHWSWILYPLHWSLAKIPTDPPSVVHPEFFLSATLQQLSGPFKSHLAGSVERPISDISHGLSTIPPAGKAHISRALPSNPPLKTTQYHIQPLQMLLHYERKKKHNIIEVEKQWLALLVT